MHPLKRSLTAQGRLAPALCSYRAGKVIYIVRSKWLDRHTYWVSSERLGARKPILPAPLIDLDHSQSAAVFRVRRTIACPIHHNPGRSPGPDHRNPHSKSALLLSERMAGHAERRDSTTECHLAASRFAGVCATRRTCFREPVARTSADSSAHTLEACRRHSQSLTSYMRCLGGISGSTRPQRCPGASLRVQW